MRQLLFKADDLVELNDLRSVELSNGSLFTTVFYAAKRKGEKGPSCTRVDGGLNNGMRYERHAFLWSDIVTWLAARGLTPTIHRERVTRPIKLHVQEQPHLIVKSFEEQPLKEELQAVSKELEQERSQRKKLEATLKDFIAKTPGMLGTAEILARSVDARSIVMPAVYFLIDGMEIVYVGKTARNVYIRITRHVEERTKQFDRVFFLRCEPNDLDRLEQAYIQRFDPKYNVEHSPTRLIINRGRHDEPFKWFITDRGREFLEKSAPTNASTGETG